MIIPVKYWNRSASKLLLSFWYETKTVKHWIDDNNKVLLSLYLLWPIVLSSVQGSGEYNFFQIRLLYCIDIWDRLKKREILYVCICIFKIYSTELIKLLLNFSWKGLYYIDAKIGRWYTATFTIFSYENTTTETQITSYQLHFQHFRPKCVQCYACVLNTTYVPT